MEKSLRQSLILVAPAVLLSSCSAPTVNLATNEPIKVDINMRLDVYQYNSGQKTGTGTPVTQATPESVGNNRKADIMTFKKEGLVGENKSGLLVSRPKDNVPTERLEFIRVTIEAENAERTSVMKSLAEAQKTSLPEVQAQRAEVFRNSAFKGEWIEVPQPDGSWKWLPKEG